MTTTEARSGAPATRRGLSRLAGAWRSGPLRGPAFRLLVAGQFTSTIGDYCYAVALPWLVLSGHGGAASLGLVLACYGIPRAALTVPGGTLADRFGPRVVMLFSDGVRCALAAVFAVLAANHVTSLAALAPVAAAGGACSALFLPASMAMMPSLVDGGQLTSANAVYTGALQVGSLLGPVLGGVVVAVAGPAVAFAADAGSYLVSAASLALMAAMVPRARAASPAPPPAADSAAAAPAAASVWALLRRARVLQVILGVSVTANFALTGTTEVALPALAHARFGAGGYGAVLTCMAVGSLAGTVIIVRVAGRARPATLLSAAFLLGAVAIAVAPFAGGLAGVAGAMLVFGVSLGFDNVLSVTLIQRWAPPGMLGRVMGVLILAGAGTFPLSAALAGLLARHLGPAPVFPIAGALLAVAILAGLTQREFRDFGAAPRGGGAAT